MQFGLRDILLATAGVGVVAALWRISPGLGLLGAWVVTTVALWIVLVRSPDPVAAIGLVFRFAGWGAGIGAVLPVGLAVLVVVGGEWDDPAVLSPSEFIAIVFVPLLLFCAILGAWMGFAISVVYEVAARRNRGAPIDTP